MPVMIACSSCRREAAVPEGVGLAFHCPHCQQLMTVPMAQSVEVAFEVASSPSSPFQFAAAAAVPESDFASPRYPAASWKWARRGLAVLAAGIVLTLVGIGGVFAVQTLGSLVRERREDLPMPILVVQTLFGAVVAAGLLAGLVALGMMATVPARSRLRGRALAATALLALAPLAIALMTLVPSVVPDRGLRLALILMAVMVIVIGALLYLLFLRDLSIHLGDHSLGDRFSLFLIQLVMCLIGLPVLVFGGYSLSMVLIGREFFFRQEAVVLIISGAAFIAVGLLHLKFLQLVLHLRGRLDEVVR